MNTELSFLQRVSMETLCAKGFCVDFVQPRERDLPVVYLSKELKPYHKEYAEVNGAGLVNGFNLGQFETGQIYKNLI